MLRLCMHSGKGNMHLPGPHHHIPPHLGLGKFIYYERHCLGNSVLILRESIVILTFRYHTCSTVACRVCLTSSESIVRKRLNLNATKTPHGNKQTNKTERNDPISTYTLLGSRHEKINPQKYAYKMPPRPNPDGHHLVAITTPANLNTGPVRRILVPRAPFPYSDRVLVSGEGGQGREGRVRIVAAVNAGEVRRDNGDVVIPGDANVQVGALAVAPPRQYPPAAVVDLGVVWQDDDDDDSRDPAGWWYGLLAGFWAVALTSVVALIYWCWFWSPSGSLSGHSQPLLSNDNRSSIQHMHIPIPTHSPGQRQQQLVEVDEMEGVEEMVKKKEMEKENEMEDNEEKEEKEKQEAKEEEMETESKTFTTHQTHTASLPTLLDVRQQIPRIPRAIAELLTALDGVLSSPGLYLQPVPEVGNPHSSLNLSRLLYPPSMSSRFTRMATGQDIPPEVWGSPWERLDETREGLCTLMLDDFFSSWGGTRRKSPDWADLPDQTSGWEGRAAEFMSLVADLEAEPDVDVEAGARSGMKQELRFAHKVYHVCSGLANLTRGQSVDMSGPLWELGLGAPSYVSQPIKQDFPDIDTPDGGRNRRLSADGGPWFQYNCIDCSFIDRVTRVLKRLSWMPPEVYMPESSEYVTSLLVRVAKAIGRGHGLGAEEFKYLHQWAPEWFKRQQGQEKEQEDDRQQRRQQQQQQNGSPPPLGDTNGLVLNTCFLHLLLQTVKKIDSATLYQFHEHVPEWDEEVGRLSIPSVIEDVGELARRSAAADQLDQVLLGLVDAWTAGVRHAQETIDAPDSHRYRRNNYSDLLKDPRATTARKWEGWLLWGYDLRTGIYQVEWRRSWSRLRQTNHDEDPKKEKGWEWQGQERRRLLRERYSEAGKLTDVLRVLSAWNRDEYTVELAALRERIVTLQQKGKAVQMETGRLMNMITVLLDGVQVNLIQGNSSSSINSSDHDGLIDDEGDEDDEGDKVGNGKPIPFSGQLWVSSTRTNKDALVALSSGGFELWEDVRGVGMPETAASVVRFFGAMKDAGLIRSLDMFDKLYYSRVKQREVRKSANDISWGWHRKTDAFWQPLWQQRCWWWPDSSNQHGEEESDDGDGFE